MDNQLLRMDSHKASHFLQYPAGTTHVSSYIEPRANSQFPEVMFFGLQMFIMKRLLKPLTYDDALQAEMFMRSHGLPFNLDDAMKLISEYNGAMPIEIRAVPEGLIMPAGNAQLQVVNTDPRAYWLTSYLETELLRAVWYPSTVATLSWRIKQIIREYMEKSCDSLDGLNFKLHDFGARGVSSSESAEIGGCSHLVNFMGSDTIEGVLAASKYYGEPMAGFSIPAAEHSTITSWGKTHETAAYLNMINRFGKPGSIFAVVSDSYDIWNAIDNIWGGVLKSEVESCGGKLVVRPDSGVPEEIVPEVIKRLMAKFGSTQNSKGYHVLPPCVGVIQGDGINEDSIRRILDNMMKDKLSVDNIAFGMGGGLLQQINRDTCSYAMKCSAIHTNSANGWVDVYKDPVTDKGKVSKRGRLAVIRKDDKFETIRLEAVSNQINCLEPVFYNGRLLRCEKFANIRNRANSY